jgi:hypothetical protein
MAQREPILRTDEQLTHIIDQPATWVIYGNGQTIGVAACLRRALDNSNSYAKSGAVVVAIARPPPQRIFIHADQISRLIQIQNKECAVAFDDQHL